MDHYQPDRNTVVDSPTGTGKSGVIYLAVSTYLNAGRKVIATAPTKVLVKAMYAELFGLFGRHIVGMNTGREADLEGKYVIVTTPEGYVSAVRSGKDWIKADLLVVDEAHNVTEPNRGPELDAAITYFREQGGRLLLVSGTFPNKKELADYLKADRFDALYRATKIHLTEIHAPDDLAAGEDSSSPVGYRFNKESVRIKKLEEVLDRHKSEHIIIFVPTKKIGNCLKAHFNVPFHHRDEDENEKQKILDDFNKGTQKVIIATSTLAQGVNTSCDVVVVFGTRMWGECMDKAKVDQMYGRGGRNKPESTAYIIGDKLELFCARKYSIAKTGKLPVESMSMTVLAQGTAREADICWFLRKTYAGHRLPDSEVAAQVARYMRYMGNCGLLAEKPGGVTLTFEGMLLARYCVYPSVYMGYVKLARRIREKEGLFQKLQQKRDPSGDLVKGAILLAYMMPTAAKDCPPRLEKDIRSVLNAMDSDVEVNAKVAGSFLKYISQPLSTPPYLGAQLRDMGRFVSLLKDLHKYVHREWMPGLDWMVLIMKSLSDAISERDCKLKEKEKGKDKKAKGKGKVVQLPLMREGTAA